MLRELYGEKYFKTHHKMEKAKRYSTKQKKLLLSINSHVK